MNPLLDLAGHEIPAYRLFTLAALCAALTVAVVLAARRGVRIRDALAVFGGATAGGVIGARLFAALVTKEPFLTDVDRLLALRPGDMAIYGGLAGAGAAGSLIALWRSQSVRRLADDAAPALGVGIALCRCGCHLAGCCFGTETDLPVGVTYPGGSTPALHQLDGSAWSLFEAVSPVHPIPIYEIVVALVLAALALWLRPRIARPGMAAATFVGGYSLARFAIHPVRASVAEGLLEWLTPALYLAVAAVTIGWMWWQVQAMRPSANVTT